MRNVSLLLVLGLILAGCTTTNEPSEAMANEPMDQDTNEEPNQVAQPNRTPATTNRTTVIAATDDPTFLGLRVQSKGPTVLEIQLDVGAKQRCSLDTSIVGTDATNGGPAFVRLTEYERGGYGWTYYGATGLASVNVADLDRIIIGDDEQGNFRALSSFESNFEGVMRFTLMTSEARVYPPNEPDNASLQFEMDCEATIEVLSVRSGTETTLYGRSSIDSLAGADVSPVGGASVQGRGSATVAAENGRILASRGGYEYGPFQISSPGGSAVLGPTASGLIFAEGGPGEYAVETTELGAVVDLFWAGILGFDNGHQVIRYPEPELRPTS